MTVETLTAEDFQMKYDAEHTFPFFEDEDGVIFAYGWPKKDEIARQVIQYYELCGMKPEEDDYTIIALEESVQHTWGAMVEGYTRDEDFRFHIGNKYKDAEGAFPLTLLNR